MRRGALKFELSFDLKLSKLLPRKFKKRSSTLERRAYDFSKSPSAFEDNPPPPPPHPRLRFLKLLFWKNFFKLRVNVRTSDFVIAKPPNGCDIFYAYYKYFRSEICHERTCFNVYVEPQKPAAPQPQTSGLPRPPRNSRISKIPFRFERLGVG